MRRDWWVPLTGIVFVILLVVGGIALAGEPPEASQPVQEVVDFYVDNKDSVIVGAALLTLAAALIVIFASYLRSYLADAEGGENAFPNVAFAGAIILATGAAIDATLSFAMAEAVGDVEPTSIQAMQAIWDHDFMPMALGIFLLLLGSGVSILRTGALPKWLAIVAIILAVLVLTPIGFAAFIGGALWIAIVSVMLTMRYRKPGGVTGISTAG